MNPSLFLPMISVMLWAGPQDQAERLFDNALTFMNAERYNEAITDFESIITAHNGSTWAPKALLELGNYYLNINQDPDKALTYYDRIQTEYGSSTEAPAAYYFKARIAEDRGKDQAQLTAAVADLVRMSNLFPDNPWQEQATFLFGELSLRLEDYGQTLNQFHRLEMANPNSPLLADALLSSSLAAYLSGKPEQAVLCLARLQARFPNSEQADMAADYLRLLDRFEKGSVNLELDQSFFGSAPKRFASPTAVHVSGKGRIAIRGSKTTTITSLRSPDQRSSVSSSDLVDFATARSGELMLVYEDKVVAAGGSPSYTALSLRDIRAAGVDSYGRLYVADNDARDVLVYSAEGTRIKSLGVNKAKMVRCYAGTSMVLNSDSAGLRKFDANLQSAGAGPGGLANIYDYCFDVFGNLYVLHDKGNQVSIFTYDGKPAGNLHFKSGAFSVKQAQSIAVDQTGAIYLADRRGGSVFRLQ